MLRQCLHEFPTSCFMILRGPSLRKSGRMSTSAYLMVTGPCTSICGRCVVLRMPRSSPHQAGLDANKQHTSSRNRMLRVIAIVVVIVSVMVNMKMMIAMNKTIEERHSNRQCS